VCLELNLESFRCGVWCCGCGDELMSWSCVGGVSWRVGSLRGGGVGVVLSSLSLSYVWLGVGGGPIPWSGLLYALSCAIVGIGPLSGPCCGLMCITSSSRCGGVPMIPWKKSAAIPWSVSISPAYFMWNFGVAGVVVVAVWSRSLWWLVLNLPRVPRADSRVFQMLCWVLCSVDRLIVVMIPL
jgi:hypothetical protein